MDARIPCPVCGQQIHPVAGRCKHCKTDLVKLRAPVRPIALPAPVPPSVPAPDPAPFIGSGPTNGHNGHTMAPAFAALAASDAAPRGSFLARRWPILVAIVAGIAIVVCAYLLLFEKESAHAQPRKASGAAAPAPDRMDTMPAPPAPQGHLPDPWDSPGTAPNTPPQLPPDFDDPPPAAPDPAPNPAPSPQLGAVPPAEEFFSALTDKLTTCLGVGSVDLSQWFGGSSFGDQMREMVRNGRCTYNEAKAAQCLEAASAFDCSKGPLDLDDIMKIDQSKLMGLNACGDALVCR